MKYYLFIYSFNHRPGQFQTTLFKTMEASFPLGKAIRSIAVQAELPPALIVPQDWKELTEEQYNDMMILSKEVSGEQQGKSGIISS
jgi:hypothetical protein